MANVPIKSIKFPGLDDTYTFLQNDASLSQSGKAADAKKVGDEIGDLKSAITDTNESTIDCNMIDLFALLPNKLQDGSGGTKTKNGVTFTYLGNGKYSIVGTSTASTIVNIYANANKMPTGFSAGKTCYMRLDGFQKVWFEMYYSSNGSDYASDYYRLQSNADITIPNNATGLLFRFAILANQTVNETVTIQIYSGNQNEIANITTERVDALYQQTAHDIVGTVTAGKYINFNGGESSSSSFFYTKFDIVGYEDSDYFIINALYFSRSTDINIVTFFDESNNKIGDIPKIHRGSALQDTNYLIDKSVIPTGTRYIVVNREKNQNVPATTLQAIVSTPIRNEYVNNYTFNTVEETNTINATPEITTDSHNYLAASGDTTDRTAEIHALLATGECRLGPGNFYTTGITIPTYARLVGSGMATRIILSDSVTNGFAVKLGDYAVVQNMMIRRANNITLPDAEGDVHGIAFFGTQTPSNQSGVTREYCTINNVLIANFNGGGITCRGTGYNYADSLNVSDVVIRNCYAGINISFFSEFHRFTNVLVSACKIGCVNNGGNNVFVNCGFNGSVTNILMDNSQGQSPNNSHGSYIGCTINHAGNNTGKAIDLKGLNSGEVFVGCQVFYGSINVDNCNGIRFIGLNMGNRTPINITNSTVVVFSDSTVRAEESTLTQSNNTTLKFINCYDRTTGAVFDPMA